MVGRSPRTSGVPQILIGVGLILTVGFILPYRPWGSEPNPLNGLVLFGPVVLAAGLAIAASRQKKRGDEAAGGSRPEKGPAGASLVIRIGLGMLLVGGFPWIYTPLFFNGESNTSSGMIGTIIFLLIGLPGLAVTAIGFIIKMVHRRANVVPKAGLGKTTR